jgi:hypothetical protein
MVFSVVMLLMQFVLRSGGGQNIMKLRLKLFPYFSAACLMLAFVHPAQGQEHWSRVDKFDTNRRAADWMPSAVAMPIQIADESTGSVQSPPTSGTDEQQPAAAARAPLEGRVEVLEHSREPSLPADFLNGSASQDDGLPAEFAGRWYGDIKVMQMETYPHLHRNDAYAQEFIREIQRFVHLNQPGQITLNFKANRVGNLALSSSDVVLRGRVRLELACTSGPALVRGGYNMPRVAMNRVTRLSNKTAEQTRLDRVTIVDEFSRPIRGGFTEITASYTLKGERKMQIKLLDIDYDQNGAPLWKVLLEGEARR